MAGPRVKAAVVAALALTIAGAADSVQMKPGRWREAMRITAMTLDGESIPVNAIKRNTAARFTCISRQTAADPRRHFAEVQPGDECVVLEGGVIAGGRLSMRGRCNFDEKVPFMMVLEGTYGAESYHVTVRGEGTLDGKAMTVSGTADGTYIGRCKGDEDKA